MKCQITTNHQTVLGSFSVVDKPVYNIIIRSHSSINHYIMRALYRRTSQFYPEAVSYNLQTNRREKLHLQQPADKEKGKS